MNSCRKTHHQHQTPPAKGHGQTPEHRMSPRDILSQKVAALPQEARPKMVTQDVTGKAGTNATSPSTRQPISCTCQRLSILGLGASPFRACLALLWRPHKLRELVIFVKHSTSRQAYPQDYTDINPYLGLKSQVQGWQQWLH